MTVSVTVTAGVAVEVTPGVAVEVTPGVAVEVTPGVPEAVVWLDVAPEEGALAPEAGAVRVPETVTDGVKVGIVGDVEDPPQAETATGARRIRALQHRAVSLARSAVPVIVVRTFMGPPHAPGR